MLASRTTRNGLRIFEDAWASVSVKEGRDRLLNHRPEQGSVQLHIPHPRMVAIRAIRNVRSEAYFAPGTNEKIPPVDAPLASPH